MPLYNFICHIIEQSHIGSGIPDKTLSMYSIFQTECKDLFDAVNRLKNHFFPIIGEVEFINNKEVWINISGGIKVLNATNNKRDCDSSKIIYQNVQILEFNELST